jgi:hypothetical protein
MRDAAYAYGKVALCICLLLVRAARYDSILEFSDIFSVHAYYLQGNRRAHAERYVRIDCSNWESLLGLSGTFLTFLESRRPST